MDAPADLFSGIIPDVALILGHAARIAASRRYGLWLIGGAVRDLLRGAALDRDIDLAVEGDAVDLAAAIAEMLGGRVLASHGAFGTATLVIPCVATLAGELTLDLAGTRTESYPQPAALPVVRPAAITDDLRRRDFSLNAIAVELLADDGILRAGTLLDPFGGRADLEAGRLRLLHPYSLRDDPTRILRGLRLASRLDLHPDAATAAQIAEALERGYLGMLTPERILGEICLALDEPHPDAVLALCDAWRVTPQIAPGLAWSAALAARVTRGQEAGGRGQRAGDRRQETGGREPGFRSSPLLHPIARLLPSIARFLPPAAHPQSPAAHPQSPAARPQSPAIHPRPPLLTAGLLCYDMKAEDLTALTRRYPLPVPFARLVQEIASARAIASILSAELRPSQIDQLLRPFSEIIISVIHYAEAELAGQVAAHYLHTIRPARAPLDGRDMQRLGVAPGPMIGRILDDLRVAYLDGDVTTREQAEIWVRERIALLTVRQ